MPMAVYISSRPTGVHLDNLLMKDIHLAGSVNESFRHMSLQLISFVHHFCNAGPVSPQAQDESNSCDISATFYAAGSEPWYS